MIGGTIWIQTMPVVEVFNVSVDSLLVRILFFVQCLVNFVVCQKGEQSGQIPGGGSGLIDLEMEKILEDSAPFKVRAKRGCATHPRSIAERVR